jgi:Polyketide cyclase / dehydrase and lipid transport
MAVIIESIEISRRPEDIFSYATDFAYFPQWQGRVVSARREGDARLAVGSKAVVTRRVGPRVLLTTEEITDLNPPMTWEVRGIGSMPVTAIAKGTIESLDGATGRALRSLWSSRDTESASYSFRSSSVGRRASSCPGTRNGSRTCSNVAGKPDRHHGHLASPPGCNRRPPWSKRCEPGPARPPGLCR